MLFPFGFEYAGTGFDSARFVVIVLIMSLFN